MVLQHHHGIQEGFLACWTERPPNPGRSAPISWNRTGPEANVPGSPSQGQCSRALFHHNRWSLIPPLPRFLCPWHSPTETNTPQAQPAGLGDRVPFLGQHQEAQEPFLGVTSPQGDPRSVGQGETATEGGSQGKTDLLSSNLSLLACGGALRQHPDTFCSLCSYSKVWQQLFYVLIHNKSNLPWRTTWSHPSWPQSPCAIPGTMSFISQSLWLSFSLSLPSPQTSPCSHFQPHKRPGLDLNSKTKNLEVPALGIPNQHFFTPCSYTHWHLPLAEFASQNTN